MKITPVAAPAPTAASTPAESAKARAVAAFMKGATPPAAPQEVAPKAPPQAQEYVVADANQVSPEEMSAIKQTQPQTETQPDTETEETPEVIDITRTKEWQQLARQERAMRAKAQQQDQAFKAREAAVAAREAELAAKDEQYRTGYISKDQLKRNALQALAEAGVSYDEVTQQVINQVPRDPAIDAELQALKDEIKALRQGTEETKKSWEQKQQDDYKAAVNQIRQDVTALVKQDPDTYEVIAKTNSERHVVDLIERTFQQEGRIMTVEEAAKEVEDYLAEESYSTLSRIDKIKKRLMPQAQEETADVKTQATNTQTQPTMKTLTNATASTRKLTSRERALLAFKGELK